MDEIALGKKNRYFYKIKRNKLSLSAVTTLCEFKLETICRELSSILRRLFGQ